MRRQLAVFMTAGALGLGLAGCGCDCPTGAAAVGKQTPLGEACAAVDALSTNLEPVTAIKPTTTADELRKVRDDIDRDVDKITGVDKRGFIKEDLRVNLARYRKEFVQGVDSFGTTTNAVGTAAPRLNESYQGVRGTLRAMRGDIDCSDAS